jgi:hypothetical protein
MSIRAANRHGSSTITFHFSLFTSVITDLLITSGRMRNDRIIRVSHGFLPAGTWENVRARPHPELADYVREYQGYFEASSQPLRRREIPSGDVSIIISFGTRYEMIDPRTGGLLGQRRTFVAGLDDGPLWSTRPAAGWLCKSISLPSELIGSLKSLCIWCRTAPRNCLTCWAAKPTDWLNASLELRIGKLASRPTCAPHPALVGRKTRRDRAREVVSLCPRRDFRPTDIRWRTPSWLGFERLGGSCRRGLRSRRRAGRRFTGKH